MMPGIPQFHKKGIDFLDYLYCGYDEAIRDQDMFRLLGILTARGSKRITDHLQTVKIFSEIHYYDIQDTG